MKPILGRFYEHTYELLRIFTGAMFMIHGTQKILGWPPSQMKMPHTPIVTIGGILELVCGGLVLIGLFTTIAAFIASGEMAAAYFMAHAHGSFWPIVNKGELAVVYCFVFLFLAAHGSGRWSLDQARRRRR